MDMLPSPGASTEDVISGTSLYLMAVIDEFFKRMSVVSVFANFAFTPMFAGQTIHLFVEEIGSCLTRGRQSLQLRRFSIALHAGDSVEESADRMVAGFQESAKRFLNRPPTLLDLV